MRFLSALYVIQWTKQSAKIPGYWSWHSPADWSSAILPDTAVHALRENPGHNPENARTRGASHRPLRCRWFSGCNWWLNAAHVQFLAEAAHVVEVDAICPAGGVEGIEDLFGYFPQFQQEIVDIDTCRIHQRHRCRRFLDVEALCQDSMKNDCRFSARHERIGIRIIRAQPELPPHAQDVVSRAERCLSLVERAVINRNIRGGKVLSTSTLRHIGERGAEVRFRSASPAGRLPRRCFGPHPASYHR